jgi:hypothetical protein
MIFTAPSRFRWALCQLQALRHYLAPRVQHIWTRHTERILRDINKANRDHAHRPLQCLTVAVCPLRVAELAGVLAVDFGIASHRERSKLNSDRRWEDQQEAVLSRSSLRRHGLPVQVQTNRLFTFSLNRHAVLAEGKRKRTDQVRLFGTFIHPSPRKVILMRIAGSFTCSTSPSLCLAPSLPPNQCAWVPASTGTPPLQQGPLRTFSYGAGNAPSAGASQ